MNAYGQSDFMQILSFMFRIWNRTCVMRSWRRFLKRDLPRNAYYGDGTPIETSILDQIRQAYQGVAVQFPWQQRDVLMLDNMLVAHGRAPYKGARKILVAMAEPYCEK